MAAYYVRQAGRILGPFSRDMIDGLIQRGRIPPDAEVSADRVAWTPLPQTAAAESVESPLAPLVPTLVSAGSTLDDSIGDGTECFFTVDGQRVGPLPIAALRRRAALGEVQPTDMVWIAGHQDWLPAETLPGMLFKPPGGQLSAWIRSNRALAISLALAASVLIGVPFVLTAQSLLAEKRADEAEILAAQKKEAQIRDELAQREARLRDELDRLLAREKMNHEQETTLRRDIGQMEMQYYSATAQGIQSQREQQKLTELNRELERNTEVAQQIKAGQESVNAQLERVQSEMQESNRLQRKDMDESHGQPWFKW